MATPEPIYDAGAITVLEGLDAVRLRPSMYIGNTSTEGLHHMVWEVLDNSIDEAQAGFCDKITVELIADVTGNLNKVAVTDNGRGIPVDMHETGVPAVQVVLTKLHAGGKFNEKAYSASGGLHGVGVSCVNALSKLLEVIVSRDGQQYVQHYSRGEPIAPLRHTCRTKARGTRITFSPDPEIFPRIEFDYNIVFKKLQEASCLHAGVRFVLEAPGKKPIEFYTERGLIDFLERIEPKSLHAPFHVTSQVGNIHVDVALQWGRSFQERIFSYCNGIHTEEGGTHLLGFKMGLLRAVQKAVLGHETFKKSRVTVTPEDVREGLTAIVSVRVPQPQFEGQTKTKLGTPEVRTAVETLISSQLPGKLTFDEKVLTAIGQKIITAAKTREAAKKAKEAVRKASSLGIDNLFTGKLAECQSKDPRVRELFIVEGDSAGGSAKQGRSRIFQAILPLRGKVLNVERANLDRMMGNEEIKSLISAIGTGIGEAFNLRKLRYHKIVIMTDADVDGAHIRTLLLTLFFRQFPELVAQGHIYIAQPPLYRIQRGKKEMYVYDDNALEKLKAKVDLKGVHLQRYKGLGEMSAEQLWETTLDPERRSMLQVTVPDAARAHRLFSLLMGDDVAPRYHFINKNAKYARAIDI